MGNRRYHDMYFCRPPATKVTISTREETPRQSRPILLTLENGDGIRLREVIRRVSQSKGFPYHPISVELEEPKDPSFIFGIQSPLDDFDQPSDSRQGCEVRRRLLEISETVVEIRTEVMSLKQQLNSIVTGSVVEQTG